MDLELPPRADRDKLLKIGMPSRFTNVECDFKDAAPHKVQVLNYLQNLDRNIRQGRGVAVIGPPSSGKTMLGCYLFSFIAAHMAAKFSHAFRIQRDEVDRVFDQDAECSVSHINETIDALFIDALGTEKNMFEPTYMDHLTDLRHANECITFYTLTVYDGKKASDFIPVQMLHRMKRYSEIIELEAR